MGHFEISRTQENSKIESAEEKEKRLMEVKARIDALMIKAGHVTDKFLLFAIKDNNK